VSSLQQRIRKIEEEIEQLQEDKQFYELIIEELQDTTSTEDELSSFGTIEFIQEPIQPQ
jgi:DNA-binding ferritin-like protein